VTYPSALTEIREKLGFPEGKCKQFTNVRLQERHNRVVPIQDP